MRRLQGPPDLTLAPGHWVRRDLIAWPADGVPSSVDPAELDWQLHWSPDGGIDPGTREPVVWDIDEVRLDLGGLPEDVLIERPHLRGYLALRLRPETAARAGRSARSGRAQPAPGVRTAGQRRLAAAAWGAGRPVRGRHPGATRAELAGPDANPAVVGADRARRPAAHLETEDDLHDPGRSLPAAREADGCWAISGGIGLAGARYRWESPSTPRADAGWSPTRSPTPTRSRSPSTRPRGDRRPARSRTGARTVANDPQPRLSHAVDQVIYELHVRDFSIGDKSVPAGERWQLPRVHPRQPRHPAPETPCRRGFEHRAAVADVRQRERPKGQGAPAPPSEPTCGPRPRTVRTSSD